MRLINIRTYKLREFIGNIEDPIPPYAILSHTWGHDEVMYSEMMNPTPATEKKEGYIKMKNFAAAVDQWPKRNDVEYVWVDTCCIDKSSSAELSEAINSMYQWYKHAKFCFVYLSDVARLDLLTEHDSSEAKATYRNSRIRERCRWMKRGWTLQELLANSQVMFFTRDWDHLLTKTEWIPQLSMLLGIGRDVLTTCDPSLASVAQRMSWASRRHTTRPEDMAYCLMGIFDVNMPLLYGEGGEKAFIRLQEEIMKSSDDHSLFAWRNSDKQYASYYGLLASSPQKFVKSRNIAFVDNPEDDAPFSVTNKGLSIKLHLVSKADKPGHFIGLLNCRDPGPDGEPVGLYLVRLSKDQYARIDSDKFWTVEGGHSSSNTDRTVHLPFPIQFFVRQNIRLPADYLASEVGGIFITEDIGSADISICEASPNVAWVAHEGFITILSEDSRKQEYLCYSSRSEATMGAIVIILMWDRQLQKFGAKFHHYSGWPNRDTSLQARLLHENLLQSVGSPIDEFKFYAAGSQRVASVDMRLGLMDRQVVIKVAIRIK
ncbi:heterokaryon incompatibility protein-domain-containing protein [Nemania sp. FL0916]|nr:heterokaryon incompatibility protein-domain-containing protein [Nemania sp. FL0916]